MVDETKRDRVTGIFLPVLAAIVVGWLIITSIQWMMGAEKRREEALAISSDSQEFIDRLKADHE